MTTLRWSDKDPADVWDYTLDARDWIAAVSGTLTGVTVAASPSGLTIGSTGVTAAGLATVRLSGGAAGTDYTVTMTLSAAGGLVLERSVMLLVSNL